MNRAIALLSLAAACAAVPAIAQDNSFAKGPIKHVLLISVDGMHAVDFTNCANGISTVNNGEPYCPAIAALGKTGVNYVAASTSKPSDSFPGLIAIMLKAYGFFRAISSVFKFHHFHGYFVCLNLIE